MGGYITWYITWYIMWWKEWSRSRSLNPYAIGYSQCMIHIHPQPVGQKSVMATQKNRKQHQKHYTDNGYCRCLGPGFTIELASPGRVLASWPPGWTAFYYRRFELQCRTPLLSKYNIMRCGRILFVIVCCGRNMTFCLPHLDKAGQGNATQTCP